MGMVRVFVLLFVLFPVTVFPQNWEFGEVKRLSIRVNSQYEEGMPLLSPDGKTLYFTRSFSPANTGGKYTGSDVWVSRYDPRTKDWGSADNKTFRYNSKGTNAVIGINKPGNTLYLINTTSTKRPTGIYFTKRVGDRWSEPEFIPTGDLVTSQYLGLYVSPDFDVLILSMNGLDTQGEEDLYVSIKNDKGWTKPKNLGPSINTSGFEISPFLSADKTRLFFSSNGHSGVGDADIFYCERLYNSWETWSVPKNLGPKVNSKKFDAYFSMYGDSVCYFTSNRSGDLSDIYSIKIARPTEETDEILPEFLSQEEVNRISGQKVNQIVYFDENVSSLSGAQISQLNAIGAIFSKKHEIKMHLMAYRDSASTSLDIYQQRLFNILNQLKSSGIQGSRVTFGLEIEDTKTLPEKQKVEVLLYR